MEEYTKEEIEDMLNESLIKFTRLIDDTEFAIQEQYFDDCIIEMEDQYFETIGLLREYKKRIDIQKLTAEEVQKTLDKEIK